MAHGDVANKTCTIPIVDDDLAEGAETVILSLTDFTGGATPGVPATATLTIVDDIFSDGFESGNTSAWSSTVALAWI